MKYFFVLLPAAMAWGQQAAQPPVPPQPQQTAAPKPSLQSPSLQPPSLTAPAQANVAPETVILTIGTEKITKAQFEQILASLPDQTRMQMQSPAGKRRLAESIGEMKVLAQDAREHKLDQTEKVKTQIALQADQVLAQSAYLELTNVKPDDAMLHAYYDAHKQEFETISARHILIRMKGSQVPLKKDEKDLTDEEALAKAKQIREKILAGGDFVEIAKTESDDSGNANNGGDLGTFTKGRMVPQFEKAAFAAELNKVTEPVKTQFGYHLILVYAHSTKTFDEVKPEIEQKVKPEIAKNGIEQLKKKTPIVLDDTYFGK